MDTFDHHSFLPETDFFFFSFPFFPFFFFNRNCKQSEPCTGPAITDRYSSLSPQGKLQENENLLKILWTSSRKKEEKAQRVKKEKKQINRNKKKKKRRKGSSSLLKKWDFESFPITGTQFGGRKNKRDV